MFFPKLNKTLFFLTNVKIKLHLQLYLLFLLRIGKKKIH